MGIRMLLIAALLLSLTLEVSCGKRQPAPQLEPPKTAAEEMPGVLTVTSPAFAAGEVIPARYTCDGEDLSPALEWGAPPQGTACFALLCEDPDAPSGLWVHWVIYDIPDTLRGLPEAAGDLPQLDSGARQGRNDSKNIGYGGPCPPPGKPHGYYFKLFALNALSGLEPGASRNDLMKAMRDRVVARGELMGIYSR